MDAEIQEIPDVYGSIRAYRSWVWSRREGLKSQNTLFREDNAWESVVATAVCRRGLLDSRPQRGGSAIAGGWTGKVSRRILIAHFAALNKATHPDGRVPGTGCSCGLYACTNPQSSQIHPGGVFGVLDCYGAVLFGSKNSVIRAQNAKITALMMSRLYWNRKDAAALREQYPGVPVYRSFRSLMRDFPSPDGRKVRWRRTGWIQPLVYVGMMNWQLVFDAGARHLEQYILSGVTTVGILAILRLLRKYV